LLIRGSLSRFPQGANIISLLVLTLPGDSGYRPYRRLSRASFSFPFLGSIVSSSIAFPTCSEPGTIRVAPCIPDSIYTRAIFPIRDHPHLRTAPDSFAGRSLFLRARGATLEPLKL